MRLIRPPLIAVSLIVATDAQAAMPAVQFGSASPVSPTDALTYYGSPSSPTAGERDPIVKELARALNYDIDAIYEYVRDNVELLPTFGLKKGARGVIFDDSGTAFDQAHFLVELLREADAVAGKGYSPTYKVGQITLSGAQFAAWFGVSNADAARQILADGGIPAVVSGSGGSISSVTMLHIWVEAAVGGTRYAFDPSFKLHTTTAGVDLGSAMGFNGADLLAAGTSTATHDGTSISSFNASNFRARLASYRGNLEGYLASNYPGTKIDTVVGARQIVPHEVSERRRTSLPYVVSTDRTWSGAIPNAFRSALTVTVNSASYGTLYADAIYGKQLSFYYSNGSSGVTVSGPAETITGRSGECDGELSTSATAPAVASIAINHPYAAASGTYMDRTISKQLVSRLCSNGVFYLTNGWGGAGQRIGERLQLPGEKLKSNSSFKELLTASTFASVAAQYSRYLELAGAQLKMAYQLHDLIGLHHVDAVGVETRTTTSGGAYQSTIAAQEFLTMDFEAGVSVNPVDGINAPRRRAAAHVAASGLALIESAVPRQEADVVRDMTPLTLFTNQNALAATPGNYPHYLATSANWSSIRNGVLLNYPAALKSILDQYIAEGYHLLLPQAGQLRQEGYSIYVGGTGNATRTVKLVESPSTSSAELLRSAFFAYKPDGTGSIGGAAFLMYDPRRGRVLKGGVGVSLIDHVNRVLKKPEPPKAADKDAVFAAVDVNQNNGRFTYTPSADLTDGFGDFPHSLSLQRQYRMNDLADYGFGVGWRHNWHHQVTLSNDGHAAFGQLGAQGAASALVAIQAVADILGTDPSPARILAAAHVQDWLADQTINNVAVVSNGLDADASYLRQNDGSFMPAKFDGSRLVQQGEPIDSIINRRIYHQVGFTLTGRDGDVRTYTFLDAYSPNLYEAVYVAPLARKSLHLSRWTMADGIRLSLAYQQNSLTDTFYLYSVENSLGRKIVNSLFDPGDRGDRPMCSGPYSLVTYSEPRDGEVRYKNSAQQEVRFTKTAAVKFSLAPGTEPDMARCDANGEIATRLSTFPSSLTAAFDLSNGKWSYGNGTIPDLYGSLTSQGTLSGLARIYKPSMPGTPAIQVTFGNDANVRTITDATGQAYQYFSSPFRGASENPLAERSVSIFDRDGQTIRTIDPLGRVVRNDYDPEGRLVRTTSPDLDAVEYTYDVRSNRLTERKKAKPGTGLADIVTTTEYFEGPSIASCANLKTCNKPRYAWDGRSNRTDYDWDGATGQLKSVTSPPDAAGVRPQVSYGYTSFAGADGASFSLPTSKVERIDGATSTTTSFSYDSANKYVPKETVVDAGGLSLRTCAHFDATGNITSVTDPRAGGCQ